MGHALGYLDHSTNSADVMYPYICGVNFITEAEKNTSNKATVSFIHNTPSTWPRYIPTERSLTMKKTLCVLLGLLLLFSFTSCGNETAATTGGNTDSGEVTLGSSFTTPNLEETLQYTSLIASASYQGSSTTWIKMFGYDVEVFCDRYTITEIFHGTCAEKNISVIYSPYEYITIDKSVGRYRANYAKQVKRTVGEEYLLLLYRYDNEWNYSDFRFVIPSDNPSSMKIGSRAITEKEHTVPLTDIDTQDKFVQYALTLVKTTK